MTRAQATRRSRHAMQHHGGISWQVIAMILGLVAMVVLIFIFLKPTSQTNTVIARANVQSKVFSCYRLGGEKNACPVTDTDRDGDCLPDTCDICIAPAGKASTQDRSKEQVGSNLFDADNDGIPDLCDPQPTNSAVATCQFDNAGKCPIPKTYYENDGKTARTIDSTPLVKTKPEDYYASLGIHLA